MHEALTRLLAAAGAAVAAAAGIAFAGGGPPPIQPADPAAGTVVATASWQARVVAPARRTNATIDRAMRVARICAIRPRSRSRATRPTRSPRRRACAPGRRRDPPRKLLAGLLGSGQRALRAGQLVRAHLQRTARGTPAGGATRRLARFRNGCPVPKTATIRVAVTYAASPR
jgi:hypothetical protein